MDDDDLPPRLLPRRPAPGEHPRALARADRRSSTSGSSGKLTDRDLSKLTRLFIDAANENVEALPKRLADLGVRYPKEREEQFVAELHTIYSRYYGSSLNEIDPLQVIREAFGLIYEMNLRLPTRFVLLDKAIATVGSVGVDLYPGLQRLRGREAVRARR